MSENVPVTPPDNYNPMSVRIPQLDCADLIPQIDNRSPRIDAIIRRFPQFANPDHQWHSPSHQTIPINQYHLRRRPKIRCPACLRGELGQLGHMEGPYGCLFSEEVKDNE